MAKVKEGKQKDSFWWGLSALFFFALMVPRTAHAFPSPEVWGQLIAHLQSGAASVSAFSGLAATGLASVAGVTVIRRRVLLSQSSANEGRGGPLMLVAALVASVIICVQLAAELSAREEAALNRKPDSTFSSAPIFHALDKADQVVHPKGVEPSDLKHFLANTGARIVWVTPAHVITPRWGNDWVDALTYPSSDGPIDLGAMSRELAALEERTPRPLLLIDSRGFLAGRLVERGGVDKSSFFLIGGEKDLIEWAGDLPRADVVGPEAAGEARDDAKSVLIDSSTPFEFYNSGYFVGAARMSLVEFLGAQQSGYFADGETGARYVVTGDDEDQTISIANIGLAAGLSISASLGYSRAEELGFIPSYRNRDRVFGFKDTLRVLAGDSTSWVIDARPSGVFDDDRTKFSRVINIPFHELNDDELAERVIGLDPSLNYVGAAYGQLDGFAVRQLGLTLTEQGKNWLGVSTVLSELPPIVFQEVNNADPGDPGDWPALAIAPLSFELLANYSGVGVYLATMGDLRGTMLRIGDEFILASKPNSLLLRLLATGLVIGVALNWMIRQSRFHRRVSLDQGVSTPSELVFRVLVTMVIGLWLLDYLSSSNAIGRLGLSFHAAVIEPNAAVALAAALMISAQLVLPLQSGRTRQVLAWVLACALIFLILRTVPSGFSFFVVGLAAASLTSQKVILIIKRLRGSKIPSKVCGLLGEWLEPGEMVETGIVKVDRLFHAARLFPGNVLPGLFVRFNQDRDERLIAESATGPLGNWVIFRSAMSDEDLPGSLPGAYPSVFIDVASGGLLPRFEAPGRLQARNVLLQSGVTCIRKGHALSRDPSAPSNFRIEVLAGTPLTAQDENSSVAVSVPRGLFRAIAWCVVNCPKQIRLVMRLRRWLVDLEHEYQSTILVEWLSSTRRHYIAQVRPVQEIQLFDGTVSSALRLKREVPLLSKWSRKELDGVLPNPRRLPSDVIKFVMKGAIIEARGALWLRQSFVGVFPLLSRSGALLPSIAHLQNLISSRFAQHRLLHRVEFENLDLNTLQQLMAELLGIIREDVTPVIWEWDRHAQRHLNDTVSGLRDYENAMSAERFLGAFDDQTKQNLGGEFGHRAAIDLDVSCARYSEVYPQHDGPLGAARARDVGVAAVDAITVGDVKQDLHDLLVRDLAFVRKLILVCAQRLGLGDEIFDIPLEDLLSADQDDGERLARVARMYCNGDAGRGVAAGSDMLYGWQLRSGIEVKGHYEHVGRTGLFSAQGLPASGHLVVVDAHTDLSVGLVTGAIPVILVERTDLLEFVKCFDVAVLCYGSLTSHLAMSLIAAGKTVVSFPPSKAQELMAGSVMSIDPDGCISIANDERRAAVDAAIASRGGLTSSPSLDIGG